jgi:hypothetical protein
LLLAALGLGGHFLWRHYAPVVAQHPQYLISAENVAITPPPPWIRSDIKSEVLRDAGLVGTLSVLDDAESFERRVRVAFEFHPWIREVHQIKKTLPAGLEVELSYRRPIAAVESSDRSSVSYLPVDVEAVRLPDADLTEVERRYLPRISGIASRPPVGEVWDDPRVVGAARLAAGLAGDWDQLRLVGIMPSTHPQIRGDAKFYTFEIITSGGTRVVWGAAPGGEQTAGESAFEVKRKRLLDFAAGSKSLDSIDGPEQVDVRSELKVVPRTARKPAVTADEDTQTK